MHRDIKRSVRTIAETAIAGLIVAFFTWLIAVVAGVIVKAEIPMWLWGVIVFAGLVVSAGAVSAIYRPWRLRTWSVLMRWRPFTVVPRSQPEASAPAEAVESSVAIVHFDATWYESRLAEETKAKHRLEDEKKSLQAKVDHLEGQLNVASAEIVKLKGENRGLLEGRVAAKRNFDALLSQKNALADQLKEASTEEKRSELQLPAPEPRWALTWAYDKDDPKACVYKVSNLVPDSVALRVRVEPVKGKLHIKDAGYWKDLSGIADGYFRCKLQGDAEYLGATIELSWFDEYSDRASKKFKITPIREPNDSEVPPF